jgi:hypothetical protein
MSDTSSDDKDEAMQRRQIVHAVFEAQRAAVRGLHDSGGIGDAVLRRMERDLEAEELQAIASVDVNPQMRR